MKQISKSVACQTVLSAAETRRSSEGGRERGGAVLARGVREAQKAEPEGREGKEPCRNLDRNQGKGQAWEHAAHVKHSTGTSVSAGVAGSGGMGWDSGRGHGKLLEASERTRHVALRLSVSGDGLRLRPPTSSRRTPEGTRPWKPVCSINSF